MTANKTARLVTSLIILLTLAGVVPAQRGRWEYLGQSRVNSRVDHDRIRVTRRGMFRSIQLGIKGGDIEFQRVVVHFDNGENQEVEVRDRINSGGKTRVIDLPGNRRNIRSVEFWYGKPNWRTGRATLNLWGRR